MKFPVMRNQDIPEMLKGPGISFFQEVEGVVDAVHWRLRWSLTHPDFTYTEMLERPNMGDTDSYWVARSTCSDELLRVVPINEKVEDPTTWITLTDEIFAEVDVKYKQLMNDLDAELEQNLEPESKSNLGELNEPQLSNQTEGSTGGDAETYRVSGAT